MEKKLCSFPWGVVDPGLCFFGGGGLSKKRVVVELERVKDKQV